MYDRQPKVAKLVVIHSTGVKQISTFVQAQSKRHVVFKALLIMGIETQTKTQKNVLKSWPLYLNIVTILRKWMDVRDDNIQFE